MKIPNKQELRQITLDHLSNIYFKEFMNLYKKCIAKPYSFFVTDTTLAPDYPFRFTKNLIKNIKTNHDN